MVLVGGTAFAQLLLVIALPFLTRLYSPEDFSALAIYVAVLTMVQVVACLRLELAVPLPEDNVVAANLLALSLLFVTLISGFTAIFLFFAGTKFLTAIGYLELASVSWLLPFGIFLAGSYQAMQFWSTRHKRFSTIARTRIMQAVIGLSVQFGLGVTSVGSIGLNLGHALMVGAGATNLARQAWRLEREILVKISRKGMEQALNMYRRFPLYSTWEALANTAANQVPVLLIAAWGVGSEAGFIFLATRVLGRPVTLIAGSVRQVHMSRASEEMRKGNLASFTTEVLSGLARVSIAPLVFLAFIAPPVFALIFGDEWRRAGELVAWMTPWFILRSMTLPASNVMHVRMLQPQVLTLNTFLLIMVICAMAIANYTAPRYLAETFALTQAASHFISLVVFLIAAGARTEHIKPLIKTVSIFTVLAALLGISARRLLGI
ncbi:lipopolysaccharide biosynthesis protein [Thalassospira alkalitolerans]|uniref:lipopolysaccharide biosynthesis protein n=1 Tax=Thalassospira alkalitolerans TaxID=1293890 RepID=UPI003AA80938